MLRPVWPEFFQSLRASCLTTESRPFFYCSVCEPSSASHPGAKRSNRSATEAVNGAFY